MTENNKEKITEIADIDESNETEIQEKLNTAKVQYPNWKGTKTGQTITGSIKEILCFKDLNGKDKHGVLINIHTKNEKYPIVSIWANTVILSGLKKISKEQNFFNFDMMNQSLKSIEGIMIALRYEGEVQPSQKGFKPYQNYSIVEI